MKTTSFSLAGTIALLAFGGACATQVLNGSGGTGGGGGAVGGEGGVGGGDGGTGGTPACDEGETKLCYSGDEKTLGVGPCVAGVETCTGGAWGPCEGEVAPVPEECNGEDDDCNGTTDDNEETCGVGGCAVTINLCLTSQCVPSQPKTEVCNGTDDDCDGEVDEADPNIGGVCSTGLQGTCGPGTFVCQTNPDGTGFLVCVADKGPTVEGCNGKDDDCDGAIDEDLVSVGQPCDTNQFGVCAAGETQCLNSLIQCEPVVPASPEICDGLDNDCNGQTDEGNPDGGGACMTGQAGICAVGTEFCQNGGLVCVPDAVASVETCNGLDDNCDGVADEGNPGGGLACGCGGTTACVSGAIACQGGPLTFFSDDFSQGNAKGWTIGQDWGIGPAMASPPAVGNPDPSLDASPSADNMLAGVVIGGNAPTAIHGYYYLESPIINTAAAPGQVWLSYKRWLNSDYTPYMQNEVQVYNGSVWTTIWQTAGSGTFDNAWIAQSFNITAYKSANMRVRFGYRIGSSGVYTISSWNLDDVLVAEAVCP